MGTFIDKYNSYSKKKLYEEVEYQKGSLNYDRKNIIKFLENLGRKDINLLLDELLSSDDIDERIEIVDNILQIIENDFVEIYDKVEDDIKDLAIE